MVQSSPSHPPKVLLAMVGMTRLLWCLFALALALFLIQRAHGSATTTLHEEGQEESIGGEDGGSGNKSRENSDHSSCRYIDYYSILGIDPGESDMSTIKAAYRAMALRWHPDKVEQDKKSESEAMLIKINEAYETLSDYDKRNEYMKTYYNHETMSELMARSSTALQSLLKLGKKMWEDLPHTDRQELIYELQQYVSNKDDMQHDATLIFNNKNVLRGFFRGGVMAVTVISGFALLGAGFFSFTVLKLTNEVMAFVFKVITFPLRIFFGGSKGRVANQEIGQQMGDNRRGGGWGRYRYGHGVHYAL